MGKKDSSQRTAVKHVDSSKTTTIEIQTAYFGHALKGETSLKYSSVIVVDLKCTFLLLGYRFSSCWLSI